MVYGEQGTQNHLIQGQLELSLLATKRRDIGSKMGIERSVIWKSLLAYIHPADTTMEKMSGLALSNFSARSLSYAFLAFKPYLMLGVGTWILFTVG